MEEAATAFFEWLTQSGHIAIKLGVAAIAAVGPIAFSFAGIDDWTFVGGLGWSILVILLAFALLKWGQPEASQPDDGEPDAAS